MIAYHLAQKEHEIIDGIIELDQSYFGGVCKAKPGRRAAGKVAVVGILKRGGKVYTKNSPKHQNGNNDAAYHQKNSP